MKLLISVKRKIQKLLVGVIVSVSPKTRLSPPVQNWELKFEEFRNYISEHQSAFPIRISKADINEEGEEKYVGGVEITGAIKCAIPNTGRSVMCYNDDFTEINRVGTLSDGRFKWTGGGIYNDKVYGFPRASNAILCYDYGKRELSEICLDTKYRKEHHYGGVLTETGMIYQPPRDTDHILVIDLNTMKVRSVYLAPSFLRLKMRYCGSVYHPNGFIYFLPERGARVIKFNPITEEYQYIGKVIKEAMVFGAVVAGDGNIYGYGSHKGLIKIDVYSESVEMLFEHLYFGCYGSKLGINGKIYGIPGDGDEFWEYDIKNNNVRSCGRYPSKVRAKCAGGFTAKNGDIYMTPAFGSEICVLRFGMNEEIPSKIYAKYFIDNY